MTDNPMAARRAEQYIRVRDEIDKINKEAAEKIKPYKDVLEKIGGELMQMLLDSGANSITTPGGTFYRNRVTSATVADTKAFRDYVLEHAAWELADVRANKVGVDNFMSMHEGKLPPGVNFSVSYVAQVRRPSNS